MDVDVRFLLANERTLLAWVRTALAVLAGGLAFSQFGDPSTVQTQTGLLAAIFAGVMISIGYWRYRHADKAIRNGDLPGRGNGPLLQVVGVLVFVIIVTLIEITRL